MKTTKEKRNELVAKSNELITAKQFPTILLCGSIYKILYIELLRGGINMALFGKKRSTTPIVDTRDRIADLGWTAFRNSKDPDKQVVIDYMAQYGIELVKSKGGLYYISHLNSRDFRGFQQMTNFRAKIASVGVVGVQTDNGRVVDHFTTLDDAYQGLKVLYESVRNTMGDDDF